MGLDGRCGRGGSYDGVGYCVEFFDVLKYRTLIYRIEKIDCQNIGDFFMSNLSGFLRMS